MSSTTSPQPAAPQPPRVFRIGEVEVTRVTERLFTGITPGQLFPDWDPAVLPQQRHWLVPQHMDAALQHTVLSVHTWVLRTPRHVILVDTGIGNGKERPFSTLFHRLDNPYLERLAAAGVTPEEVDYVLMTHLHVDHVGWNTTLVDGRWKPTFPNARYVFAQAEQDFYATPAGAPRLGVFQDSVQPLIDARRTLTLPDTGGAFLDGLAFRPTPGHSWRHMAIGLESAGEQAIFCGDVMHHPLQVLRPEWNSVFCDTPGLARESREWLLDHAAATGAVVFPAHFAGASAGRVRREGAGYAWQFL